MKNEKHQRYFRGIKLLFLGMFLLSIAFVNSVGEVSYCAERTIDGAWCQNVPLDKVDTGIGPDGEPYKSIPASCEASAYCKLGTCIDSKEGTCMENTPERVCNDAGGIWDGRDSDDIPQCQLGCCTLGDQAAYVTQTRCKQLSSLYGLEIDYSSGIKSESACIATSRSSVEGACVYDEDFDRGCVFTTQDSCLSGDYGEGVEFHEGYLCSDESLNTLCGPTTETSCVEDRDEVYFLDSCGNLANIYDASKINDKFYWSKVVEKVDSCNPASNNADSASCGNCDYYLGSSCAEYRRGEDKKDAQYGDYICRDLSCEYEGQDYQHGETFCVGVEGVSEISPDFEAGDSKSENLPGSRYFRGVCYNGEVSVEACADYRQEVCIQSDIGGFSTAACRVNKWQDCYGIDNAIECENSDRRDCVWNENAQLSASQGGDAGDTRERESAFSGSEDTNSESAFRGTGNAIFGGDEEEGEFEPAGACLPKYSPGFNFWSGGDSESLCSLASTECIVTYEKGLLGEKKCVSGCECLQSSWKSEMNNICISIGDCGSSINYIGVDGYYDENALYSRSNEEEKE
jgi:hypothetical protein